MGRLAWHRESEGFASQGSARAEQEARSAIGLDAQPNSDEPSEPDLAS
jgi:hypothetical protein